MEVHPLQSIYSSETVRVATPLKAGEAAMTVTTMEVKMESRWPENDELSAPINLGLQIGTNSAGNQSERTSIVHRRTESLLTVGQLHELQQQVLIHKHLVAGLRVPTHLLIPIWKSVVRNLGSNINGFSHLGIDYRSMMDPEPGRCRRTDGKKWRCSRNTVPHQKYCERHMHRGRQRSRKPVEASENDSPSKRILLNNPDEVVRCTVVAPASTICGNNKTKNTFPPIESVVPGPETVAETITSSTHAATAILTSCADATRTIRMVPASAPNTIATHITAVPCSNPTAVTSIPTSYMIESKDVYNISCRENFSRSRNIFGRSDTNVQKIPPPSLGFSPNSVLQVPGCSSSYCDSKINLELEPGRCRRTDGKKWRCRRNVIPNQKYCGLHMHRGSKKHSKVAQNETVLSLSAATTGTLLPSATMLLTKPDPATPNTNLSMSIQAGDKRRHDEERSNVSSSSETTISDTTITAYESISP
ncbi:growth-regulating factor 9 isoform X2 [Momordica charantia]|uniref:Growth-regulating factor n=1 Tax=Momordica charantia TaxID=3673 RepID=A0A6J1CZX1_MOMCH|nr:growth-regulating factor 9 isoform X2 [Momordica charantia]